ncbi:flavodoxin domain-containing protein [Ferdinandcohnia quinoae]|uniref:Flavodoxin domain-containing protein n=1 Tax=Fredinandcohnia quinoae TaxID=2918902 RepID=A0AAW5E4S0_9BACI|nr:flavodoxin domain-containing protein [Fredinandcohnia sp. SECRCQ15]MCH1625819.1 flavodoxin domain-containing protein [Fredinandcohnia sp. SECRCQ15]
MKIAVVYSSITGNTNEVANIIHQFFKNEIDNVQLYQIDQFPISQINHFDAIVIGTYTWGDGEIPQEMKTIYQAFEDQESKKIVTGVFGTGDRFYPHFCGAVNDFRDMLYVHSNLAATLKIELSPQLQDIERCQRLVKSVMKRIHEASRSKVLI